MGETCVRNKGQGMNFIRKNKYTLWSARSTISGSFVKSTREVSACAAPIDNRVSSLMKAAEIMHLLFLAINNHSLERFFAFFLTPFCLYNLDDIPERRFKIEAADF